MTKPFRFWQSTQLIPWLSQSLLLLLLGLLLLFFGHNLLQNLQARQLSLGFKFLQSPADFDIGESWVAYQLTDPVYRALWVGLTNTVRIVVFGIVGATILGTAVGIARLSNNWLVRQLANVYVEVLRNTPLLLQLLFWYFAVFVSAPKFEERLQLWHDISLSQRGLLLPDVDLRMSLIPWVLCLGLGVYLSQWLFRRQRRIQRERNESTRPTFMAVITLLFWLAMAWSLTRELPATVTFPQVNADGTVETGLLLTPELCALLIGLVFYTAAFIAEIVRGGILAVPHGQWEAARALGLKPQLTLQLIILPQALRVIVPPLTSQYLNLAKNSSLAIAVGYPDIYAISSTVANKSGHAVEIILILMATYLSMSLLISVLMNRLNRRIQLVER